MGLFLVTFCIMAMAVFGMAIGVVFGRSPIAGSCGGLGAVDGSGRCQSCSRPCRSARRSQKGLDTQVQSRDGQKVREGVDDLTSTGTTSTLQDFRKPGIR